MSDKIIQGTAANLLDNVLDKAADISLAGYDIVIWGAGNTTDLNKETILEEKLLPCFFADGDSKKWGNFLCKC